MTNRERMLRVFRGGELDRIPFVHVDNLAAPNEELWRALGRENVGISRWSSITKLVSQNCKTTTEHRIIKDGSYNIDQGVGVRAISGEKTGFAYADQISLLALEQSAQAARTIVRDSGDGKVQTLGAVEHSPLYTSVDPLQSMSREEKLDILRRVDKVAREADKRGTRMEEISVYDFKCEVCDSVFARSVTEEGYLCMSVNNDGKGIMCNSGDAGDRIFGTK